MELISLAVYLIAVVTVVCRGLHEQHPQTTTMKLEETTVDWDIGVIDEIDQVDDILLTEEQRAALRQRKAIEDVTFRWTEGAVSTDGSGNKYPEVPYRFQIDEPSFCKTIDPIICSNTSSGNYSRNYCPTICNKTFKAFPATLQPLVEKAIQEWKDHTCIDFVDITSEPENSVQRQKPHILFAVGPKCNSHVGMINEPGQILNIGRCSGIHRHGSRVHEIGHSMGFHHEHRRSDRHKYIKVFFNDKKTDDDNYGIEYDYASVMHGYPYVLSNSTDSYKVTMVPFDPVNLQLLGQRDGLSFRDIHLANEMYKCIDKWESKCGCNKPKTCGEGYTGKHCTCVCPPHKTGSQCELETPGSNGDYYYERRNQALDEKITTPMRLTVNVPDKEGVKFVKSVDPPACKQARVTFTSSNLMPQSCRDEFLHVITDHNQLEGETLCDADLDSGRVLTSNDTIIINTKISRRPFCANKGIPLWEAEITFHDIAGCITPQPQPITTKSTPTTTITTAAPATTAAATTTTATSTTTTSEYKQYGKYWRTGACPIIKAYYSVDSCEACKMNCTDHDKCTAVNCAISWGRCQLLQCTIPAPEPTLESPGWNGYAIEPREYKQYGKYWRTGACPVIKAYYYVDSCEACKMNCTDHDKCTAVDCGINWGRISCQLYQCTIPAPEPTLEYPGWNGYAIEPRGCSNFFTSMYNPWSQIVYGTLQYIFPRTESEWKLDLTFDRDVTDIYTRNMYVEITSARMATLTPKHWNKYQIEGNLLPIKLHIWSDGMQASMPITSKLNDDEPCQIIQPN